MPELSENQIQLLSERLHARRFELLEDIMVPVRESHPKEAARFDQLLENQQDTRVANDIVELNPAYAQDEVRRLRGVQAAIDRMERGTYGSCTRCGCPINPDRLNLQPSVTCCAECEAETDGSAR